MSRPFARIALALALSTSAASAETGEAPAAEVTGLELGTLTLGRKTYHDVRVVSRDHRSVFFRHRDGLASLRLRELPSELQALLGYDPASAPPDIEPPRPPSRPVSPAKPEPAWHVAPPPTSNRLDALFLAIDQAPVLHSRQTLQPEFIRLGFAVKNQGRRPSCAVYAIVSALEFQNARLTGTAERLSEEYLTWATRRVLGLTGPADALRRDPNTGDYTEDAGYTLPAVVAGLQSFGIPLHDDMPNQPGRAASSVPEPTIDLIARARNRRLVHIAQLPGLDATVIIPRIVHALNSELPVPIGLRWPHEYSIHAGVLTSQKPMKGAQHAVTVVGYECPTGRIEDTFFIFKNSYGPRWGQGGYGRVSYDYLSQHLLEAYVLDVRAPLRPATPGY